MRLFILSLMLMAVQNLYAQEVNLLVGTYTNRKSEGIYVYKFNTSTGELKPVSTLFVKNPSYLALSKDKKHVYAVSEDGDNKGGVSAFSFDEATGKLNFINSQLSNGDNPCYVSIDNSGKWVAVGNYSGGNLSILPVKDDGSLGEAVQTIQHNGTGANKERQEQAHVHAVVFTPDGKYLAVTDLGLDKIMLYPFSADNEKPLDENATATNTKPGSGPRHIIFHPNLPFAYTIEELSGEVSAYSYKNGSLEHMQSITSHPKNYKGEIGSAAIKLSKDGKCLYASNRGESNTIAVFAINHSTGKLSTNGIFNSGGKAPRDFTLDPSDKFILSANGDSDNIMIYKRNKKNGLAEGAGKQISTPNPVCLVFF